jgi:hypothetical protein
VKAKALLAVISIMLLASSAWACQILTFTGNADCYGWTASGTNLVCGSRDTLAYVVTLSEGGNVVATFSDVFVVWEADPTFSFNIPWGMELCGDYVANGHFYYINESNGYGFEDFEVAFTCECEEGACHFTPGYWKNHAEAWPVTTLTLGSISYNQAQLLAILNLPVRSDPTVILAHHLIAAKLNVANGADDSINGAIAVADNLLSMYPVSSAPPKPAKTAIIAAKDVLCAYNETKLPGCDGYVEPILNVGAPGSSQAPSAVENTTWGAIKSIYR